MSNKEYSQEEIQSHIDYADEQEFCVNASALYLKAIAKLLYNQAYARKRKKQVRRRTRRRRIHR